MAFDVRVVTQSTANAGKRSLAYEAVRAIDQIADVLNQMVAYTSRNMVVPEPVSPFGRAGISVDANAEDIETDNAIVIRHNGLLYNCAAVSAFDISASGSAAGATIATSKWGIGWVFMNTAGGLDVEVDKDAQDYATQIEAWTAWVTATNTLPPGSDDVCIGAVMVNEGGSGTWTWGTDSITAESETYFDFYGLPGIESAMASFAATAGAATWAYGATVLRKGDGTLISASGKTGVTIAGTAIAAGNVGVWFVYILADDVELAHQLGYAYADLDAAREAVQASNPNPHLPVAGVIYVENNSTADFTPGTTAFDAKDITATFAKVGPDQGLRFVGSGGTFGVVDKIRFRGNTAFPT